MPTSNLIQGDFAKPQTDALLGRYPDETTRYLCGAAYSDLGFRDAMLKRERDTIRAAAPETGINIELVTQHCHRASRSSTVRDLIITSLALAGAAILLSISSSDVADPVQIDILLVCCFGVLLATAIEAFRYDNITRNELTRDAYYKRHDGTVSTDSDDNVVIYSGFSPFIGSGSDVGGWSFAIDLERSGQTGTVQRPDHFELADLYDYVEEVFIKLKLPKLKIKRKLFVSGKRIRTMDLLLKHPHQRPTTRIPDAIVAEVGDAEAGVMRHYICLETTNWDGEVVVTFFLQFRRLSSKLFVEVSAFLLPPLKPAYYDLDKVHPARRARDTLGLIVLSALKSLFLPLFSPFACWGKIATSLGHSKEDRHLHKEIDEDLLFDYGARQSVRELAAGTEWRSYFQKLDKEMLHKIIQQQLVDSLVDFLDDHGVDTSEIKERTMHILNNGVFVSGGTINAQGLAVGSNAQANVGGAIRRAREKMSA